MSNKGPYVALHLRMEKDVWIRTGCSPGLSPEYDDMINKERLQRPKLLTAKSNMTSHDRKLAGLCPLNALEVARYEVIKKLVSTSIHFFFWHKQLICFSYYHCVSDCSKLLVLQKVLEYTGLEDNLLVAKMPCFLSSPNSLTCTIKKILRFLVN